VGGQHFERPHERYLSPALARTPVQQAGRRGSAGGGGRPDWGGGRHLPPAGRGRPGRLLPDLARSFYNLALVQAETDAHDDALTAAWPDIFLLDVRDALALAIDIAPKSEQDTTLQVL
jgi:hypothetical protein